MVRVVLLTDKESIPYELNQFPTKIGRHPDCHIQVAPNVGAVSRNHAQIIKDGDDYFIQDLESANGTFVNAPPTPTWPKTPHSSAA